MIDWEKSAEFNKCSVEWLKARFERFPKSEKRVWAICDKCGKRRLVKFGRYYDLCRPCSKRLDLPIEQIIEEYQNGMSTVKLGKKYGCDSAAIYKRLKQTGVKIRSRSEAQILDLPIDQIIKEYIEGGISTVELGKKYSCSPTTINKNLENSGIKIRSNSEAIKKYYENNPEACVEIGERITKYFEDNPEVRKEASRKSIEQWSNPETRDEMSKIKLQYYIDHPEAGIEHGKRHKKYYIDHPEAAKEYTKKMEKYWSDPEWCKENSERIKKYNEDNPEARKRQSAAKQGIPYEEWTGFTDKHRPHLTPIHACIQLNQRFPGSNGHHIMSSVVIFIPKILHQSVRHNFKTGVGMDEINKLAFDFLLGTQW